MGTLSSLLVNGGMELSSCCGVMGVWSTEVKLFRRDSKTF